MSPDPTAFIPPVAGVAGPAPAPTPGEVRLLIAEAKAHNAEVVGKVVDESIEASARARQQRQAEEAERRAEEARQARFEEIARRERAEAEAVAEENRRVAAEIAARQDENKARLARQRRRSLLDSVGHLDASA